jgi:hypothetical protein
MIAKLACYLLTDITPVIGMKIFIPHAKAGLPTKAVIASFTTDNLNGYLFAVDA